MDGKNFPAAIADFNTVIKSAKGGQPLELARLLAGRGLAFEGLGDWTAALKDYDQVGVSFMGGWVRLGARTIMFLSMVTLFPPNPVPFSQVSHKHHH